MEPKRIDAGKYFFTNAWLDDENQWCAFDLSPVVKSLPCNSGIEGF